jgi:LacI family transcriptional regulator
MRELPKVALLIETSREFGRELLHGIARYAQLHGPWSFHITAGDFEHSVPKMKQWKGHGIIARIPTDRVARAIVETGLPTIAVGLSDEQLKSDSPLSRIPEIKPIEKEVAAAAAHHFLDRQFRNFAYVGMDDRAWSQRRGEEYNIYLAELGKHLHVFRQSKRPQDRRWEKEQPVLADWIDKLPKPVGLFACNDDRGREVLEACNLAELRVPEEVAVLGVDNDQVFCSLSNPPLSSVALNADTAGFRAAELLDRMMHGQSQKVHEVIVEIRQVVTRRSTDIVAVEDQDVAIALQFIHREQGRKISVDKVAEEVAVSRRYLEKRFQSTIGRTILEEIQITRLELAKRLLLDTAYPISKIAEESGFGSTGYFIQFFQTRVGKTPRKYRMDLSN